MVEGRGMGTRPQKRLPLPVWVAVWRHAGYQDFFNPEEGLQPRELTTPWRTATALVVDRVRHPQDSLGLPAVAIGLCAAGTLTLSFFSVGIGIVAGWLQTLGLFALAVAMAASNHRRIRYSAIGWSSLTAGIGTALDTDGDWTYAPLAYLWLVNVGLIIVTAGLLLCGTLTLPAGRRHDRLLWGLTLAAWGCGGTGAGHHHNGHHPQRTGGKELPART
jgi:hypothetical protein